MVISGGQFRPDALKPKEVVSLLLDDTEMESKCKMYFCAVVASTNMQQSCSFAEASRTRANEKEEAQKTRGKPTGFRKLFLIILFPFIVVCVFCCL